MLTEKEREVHLFIQVGKDLYVCTVNYRGIGCGSLLLVSNTETSQIYTK